MITRKERVKAAVKRYREKHKDRLNREQRERRKNDPEYRAKRIAQTRKWISENKEAFALIKKNGVLKKNYGITLEEYSKMLSSQSGKCAICLVTPKGYLHVDHCHKTNKVRGLLCHGCNTAIGLLREDTLIIKNAIKYLDKYGA